MIRASIDIGSNSVLLLVAECNVKEKRIEKEVLNLSYVTSLGKDLDKTKLFRQDSMDATFEALATYKKELLIIGYRPEDVLVTATEASRVATNAREFYERVKLQLGFSVQLISAEDEAFYTALGVTTGLSNTGESVVIMDMGGASTELIRLEFSPFKILSTISLPVGSVRATDWKKEGFFSAKMEEILSVDLSAYRTDKLLCVAGSMTSLASMYSGHREYSDKLIDGLKIDFSTFKDFSYDLQSTSIDNLLLLFPFLGKRAPMLAGASEVAIMIGEKIGAKTLEISTRGLRYGTLIQGEFDG